MNLEAALQYAELGYQVFPCVAGAKNPLTPNGLLDATTDTERIERWWSDHPQANVAIATAGLLVVDLDVVDGKQNTWLADQPLKLIDLAAGALSLTPRGGRHYIFRQPEGQSFRNTASKLAPSVDTRADGGYILVPPSVVAGKAYRWPGEMRLDVRPEQLPEPPAWLLELLAASPRVSVRQSQPAAADAFPEGRRNAALTSLAGTMRRVGMSADAILAALLRENDLRCRPPLDRGEVETIANSVARYEPDAAAAESIGGEDDDRPQEPALVDPGKFPSELLKVPGFIGDVIEHNLRTAFKPQPVLALAAALALLATLTGRKIADRFGTRTNLYILGVCDSGGGKEHARKVNKEILEQAGLDRLIGGEGFASHAGLVSEVERKPAVLFQLDEIGRMLRTLGNASQSPHLYHIATVLMRLFTSSNSLYIGDSYADHQKNKVIHQPHACLYGTTVRRSLVEGLTEESLTDGFLARTLIFESDTPDPESREPDGVAADVPQSILEAARYWGDYRPGGDLSDQHPQPIIVPYSDKATSLVLGLELLGRKERQASNQEAVRTMWTRTTEHARKLALLYACSVDHATPLVNLDAAQWAASLAEFLTRKMLCLAADYVADSPFDVKRKRVLRAIKAAGTEGITGQNLCRATQGLKPQERAEVIDSLKQSGQITVDTVLTKTRPKLVYLARE